MKKKENNYEYVKKTNLEQKTQLIFSLLHNESCDDENVIVNLSLLFKKIPDITIFKRKDIWYNNVIEMIDIKENLKKEINEMSIQLCYYFLNVLISLNDLNIDKSVHINNLPYLILNTLTFKDLSNLFHNTELEDIFAEWIKNGKKHIINANNIFNNLNRK